MDRYFTVGRRYPEPESPKLDKLFYSLPRQRHEPEKELAEACRKVVANTTGTIVDVGCGVGTHAAFIADNTNRQVIGIDNNAYAIERAQKLAKGRRNLTFIQGDGYDLRKHVSEVGLINSHFSLHHFDLDRAVDSMAQALAFDGEITIRDFDRAGGYSLLQREIGASIGQKRMIALQKAYDEGNIVETIEKLGLMNDGSILTYISFQAAHRHQEVQKALLLRGIRSVVDFDFTDGTYAFLASRKLPSCGQSRKTQMTNLVVEQLERMMGEYVR